MTVVAIARRRHRKWENVSKSDNGTHGRMRRACIYAVASLASIRPAPPSPTSPPSEKKPCSDEEKKKKKKKKKKTKIREGRSNAAGRFLSFSASRLFALRLLPLWGSHRKAAAAGKHNFFCFFFYFTCLLHDVMCVCVFVEGFALAQNEAPGEAVKVCCGGALRL